MGSIGALQRCTKADCSIPHGILGRAVTLSCSPAACFLVKISLCVNLSVFLPIWTLLFGVLHLCCCILVFWEIGHIPAIFVLVLCFFPFFLFLFVLYLPLKKIFSNCWLTKYTVSHFSHQYKNQIRITAFQAGQSEFFFLCLAELFRVGLFIQI